MKLRNFNAFIFGFGLLIFSCTPDDDVNGEVVDARDKAEVYAEDVIKLEAYLDTHFFNYTEFDFDNPYSDANNTFQIELDTIAGTNSDKVSLSDINDFLGINILQKKQVSDDDGFEYEQYILKVREGLGDAINPIDQVFVSYEGMLLTHEIFDSTVSAVPFFLTDVGNVGGVISGFGEALVEFKTRTDYEENEDGTIVNVNGGIGAVFMPSGLGYYSLVQQEPYIPAYSNLIFTFNVEKRTLLDHDFDFIWSYLEDLNNNGDNYDDDTDNDDIPNFADADDDGDGTPTRDELDFMEYNSEPVLADNEYEYSRETVNGVLTIKTFIIRDSNSDGTPDYLDETID